MTTKDRMTIASLVLVMLAIGDVSAADQSDPIIFYRTPQGVITEESKDDAKVMAEMARENGYITLWLTSSFPFNVTMHEMTQEEIDAQQAQVAAEFAELLGALVSSGDVWHPAEGPVIKGPGCTVRANFKGLNRLLKEERIIQILSMDMRP